VQRIVDLLICRCYNVFVEDGFPWLYLWFLAIFEFGKLLHEFMVKVGLLHIIPWILIFQKANCNGFQLISAIDTLHLSCFTTNFLCQVMISTLIYCKFIAKWIWVDFFVLWFWYNTILDISCAAYSSHDLVFSYFSL
jgi:hypothetical protein